MPRKSNARIVAANQRAQAQKLRQTNVVKGRGQGSVTVIKRAERDVRAVRKIEANSFYGDRNNTSAPALDS